MMAPLTGCVTGGGGDCPADAVTVVASLSREVGRLSEPSAQHAVLDRGSGAVQATTSPALANTSVGSLDVTEPRFDLLDGTAVGKAPVGDTDLVLVTAVPADRAFAVRRAVGWNVLLVVPTGPVAARRMEDGDLDVDLSTRREDAKSTRRRSSRGSGRRSRPPARRPARGPRTSPPRPRRRPARSTRWAPARPRPRSDQSTGVESSGDLFRLDAVP
jgi:hypothetical protein